MIIEGQIIPTQNKQWTQYRFAMPENDECSVWYLEGTSGAGDIWLNDMHMGFHVGGTLQLDVTQVVHSGDNDLSIQSPEAVVLHAYPCDAPPQIDDGEPWVTFEDGEWIFNSAPFFPRGVNYTGETDDFESDLRRLQAAYINTLRVESVLPAAFYQACERCGMMILQGTPDGMHSIQKLRDYRSIIGWLAPPIPTQNRPVLPQDHNPIFDKLNLEAARLESATRRLGVFYDGERDTKLMREALSHCLGVAQIPYDHDALPCETPITFTVSILNDLPIKLEKWLLKISMTGWLPSSDNRDGITYMHHWYHLYRDLTIPASGCLDLGELTMPPLPQQPMTYHLVLQMFSLEDDVTDSFVNTYHLTARV